MANLTPCTIVMESCGGANYWARVFQRSGHAVKLISPQFVKPFVKTNKNDANDAEAIIEAASRPSMNFVPIKHVEQQDIQCVHRIRSRIVKNRTALINEIRGLNLEYGVSVQKKVGRSDENTQSVVRSVELSLGRKLVEAEGLVESLRSTLKKHHENAESMKKENAAFKALKPLELKKKLAKSKQEHKDAKLMVADLV